MHTDILVNPGDLSDLKPYWEELQGVRLPWVDPLLSVSADPDGQSGRVRLVHDGEPGGGRSGLDGELAWWEACRRTLLIVTVVHSAGFWIGDVRRAIRWDEFGRARLSGLGTAWTVFDPFQGHPSAAAQRDLRLPWRQCGDVYATLDLLAEAGGSVPCAHSVSLRSLMDAAPSAREAAASISRMHRRWRAETAVRGLAG